MIEVTRACEACDGKGGIAELATECEACGGQGKAIGMRDNNVVMGQCTVCTGSGKYFEEEYKCQICQGRCLDEKKVTLTLDFPPGISNGGRVTVKGEGNQAVGKRPGDFVVIVEEKKHDRFKRIGADLYLE